MSNELTDLLKQLCEVCPEEWAPHPGSPRSCVFHSVRPMCELNVFYDEIRGGDALWWMVRQMQERANELDAKADAWNRGRGPFPTKHEREERASITWTLATSLEQTTGAVIVRGYVFWRTTQGVKQ